MDDDSTTTDPMDDDDDDNDNAGDADATGDGSACLEDEFMEYNDDDNSENNRRESDGESAVMVTAPEPETATGLQKLEKAVVSNLWLYSNTQSADSNEM